MVLRSEIGSSWRCALSHSLRRRGAVGHVRLHRHHHSISSRLDCSDAHCSCRRCCYLEHRSSRPVCSIAAMIDPTVQTSTYLRSTNKAGMIIQRTGGASCSVRKRGGAPGAAHGAGLSDMRTFLYIFAVGYVCIFLFVVVNRFEPNHLLSTVLRLALLAATALIILRQAMP